MRIAVVTALVGLGCAGFGTSVDPGAHLGAVCRASAEAGPVLGPGAWVTLDRDPVPVPDGLRVDLHNDGSTRVSGAEVADPSVAIHEAAELSRALADRLGAPPSTTAIVAAEAEVPVERVVRVLEQVQREGLSWAVFPAASARPAPVVVPDPPDPAFAAQLRAEIEALPPEQRATTVAARVTDQVSWCPGLAEVFSAVAVAAPDSKCEFVAFGVADALPSCPWVRGDRLITTLQVVMAPDPVVATHVGLGLDPTTAAPMAVAAGTPWSEVLAQLAVADPPPSWLAVP